MSLYTNRAKQTNKNEEAQDRSHENKFATISYLLALVAIETGLRVHFFLQTADDIVEEVLVTTHAALGVVVIVIFASALTQGIPVLARGDFIAALPEDQIPNDGKIA